MFDRAPQALPPPMGPEVVEGRVASDAKEPGRRRSISRLEPAVSLVGVHEDLRGDVLRIGRGRDLGANVGIDAPEEVTVEILERRPVGKHGRIVGSLMVI